MIFIQSLEREAEETRAHLRTFSASAANRAHPSGAKFAADRTASRDPARSPGCRAKSKGATWDTAIVVYARILPGLVGRHSRAKPRRSAQMENHTRHGQPCRAIIARMAEPRGPGPKASTRSGRAAWKRDRASRRDPAPISAKGGVLPTTSLPSHGSLLLARRPAAVTSLVSTEP
jgi:hypothetical protein